MVIIKNVNSQANKNDCYSDRLFLEVSQAILVFPHCLQYLLDCKAD